MTCKRAKLEIGQTVRILEPDGSFGKKHLGRVTKIGPGRKGQGGYLVYDMKYERNVRYFRGDLRPVYYYDRNNKIVVRDRN